MGVEKMENFATESIFETTELISAHRLQLDLSRDTEAQSFTEKKGGAQSFTEKKGGAQSFTEKKGVFPLCSSLSLSL